MTPFEIAAMETDTNAAVTELRYWVHAVPGDTEPSFMSMQQSQPGYDSFEISRDEYAAGRLERFRVDNGVLTRIDTAARRVLKLRKDPHGEFTTVKGNMLIMATTGERYTLR